MTSTGPHLTESPRSLGELLIRITYADALSKEETNDLIKQNEESVRLSTEALTKIYLVNIIPIRTLIFMPIKQIIHLRLPVKYIPAWVPGAGFQRLAAYVKDLNYKIRNGPWEKVLKDIVSPISLQFESISSSRRTLVFVVPAWQTN